MSMSWIIRSITTVSRCTRDANGPSRRDSMRIGARTICRSSSTAPLNRYVPDVQDGACALGHREERARLIQRRGHRFLHEHADAGLEQIARDREVLTGGDGDADHVHAADEGAVIGEDPRVVLRRHGGGTRGVGVHHTDQLDVRQFRVDEHVVLAHVARADDTRAHLRSIRHQPVISSGSSMEPSAPFTIP